MIYLKKTFAGSVAAAAFLTFAAVSAPSLAIAQENAPAAQAPAPQAAPQGTHGAMRAHGDPVEARIKDLHSKLHITDAQEPQWNQVAQAMRDNAKATWELVQEKRAHEKTMTAVEDLQAYAQIAETHAQGVRHLATAFEGLYNTMSDDQKKAADEVFRSHKRHARQSAKQ